MGYALADAAANSGAEVILVSGPVSIKPTNPNVKVVKVESATQMLDECKNYWHDCSVGIMCAAVADYRPRQMVESKIKREHTTGMTLELVKNPDIAATLGDLKGKNQFLVGFALETENGISNALDKSQRKN